jgi:hypothetical protein
MASLLPLRGGDVSCLRYFEFFELGHRVFPRKVRLPALPPFELPRGLGAGEGQEDSGVWIRDPSPGLRPPSPSGGEGK